MSSYRFDRLKVLVIDDNPHMRLLVSAVLEAFGVRDILEAANAEDGWAMLRVNPCDVIFVDWMMDGMNGLEFTARVRTAPDTPNPFIPIIMLTGYTSLAYVNAARDGGVNEFLAKPVSSKGIMSRLVSVIEHPRPFVRTRSYFGPCRRRRRSAEYDGPDRRTTESEFLDTKLAPAA